MAMTALIADMWCATMMMSYFPLSPAPPLSPPFHTQMAMAALEENTWYATMTYFYSPNHFPESDPRGTVPFTVFVISDKHPRWVKEANKSPRRVKVVVSKSSSLLHTVGTVPKRYSALYSPCHLRQKSQLEIPPEMSNSERSARYTIYCTEKLQS